METKASLGCGSLILIALIVLIFGNSNDEVRKLRVDIQTLDSSVKDLRTSIDSQARELQELKLALEAEAKAPPREEPEPK